MQRANRDQTPDLESPINKHSSEGSHIPEGPGVTRINRLHLVDFNYHVRQLGGRRNSSRNSILIIASAIGLISAVVDNVPLVAATMGMYDVSSFPQDSRLRHLIALCACTSGSILIIGSFLWSCIHGDGKGGICLKISEGRERLRGKTPKLTRHRDIGGFFKNFQAFQLNYLLSNDR
ncbi:hypothetical protein Fmac_016035 [Flemingia macrophylla]|uniref:Uncharacterized protein n=1 Tax=Flemingia macrophylla TaxID=520843 RepID=A0ABD1MGC3_9FABA